MKFDRFLFVIMYTHKKSANHYLNTTFEK